jgi:hypothetical protein
VADRPAREDGGACAPPPFCALAVLSGVQCFEEGASPSDPVAWHNRHRKLVVDGRPVMRPAAMGLSERAAAGPLRDQIVLSWMIVTEMARTWHIQ